MKGSKERWKDGWKEGKEDRKDVKWAELDHLAGRFWPTGRMFDTPALEFHTQSSQILDL